MRNTVLSGFFLFAIAMFFVSCGSDTTADNSADDKLTTATTPANNPAAKPAATPPVPTGPTTVMEFAATTFDFGKVMEGEKVSHTYNFKNTGKEPLVLSNAKGSCGCTVPKWPKDPIAPGASGEVTVEFNSKNKKGKRNQKVTITANTEPAQTVIFLTGEVEPDPNKPATPAPTPGAPGQIQPKIQVNK